MNESERERQLAAFRSRLDPPSKAKPQNVVIRVFNAPFTIWLLSAIVITLGSAYITGYQKCEADAGRLITNHYKLQLELMRRLDYVRSGIARATSLTEAKAILDTQPFVYDDLKGRTTRDLLFELRRNEQLIDYSRSRSFSRARKPYTDEDGRPFRFSPKDLELFGPLAVGEWSYDVTDTQLDASKHFVDAFVRSELAYLATLNRIALSPKCTFVNAVFGVPPRGPRRVVDAIGP